MSSAEKKGKIARSNHVSIWNWLGTLVLFAIPGVNLIALIAFLILAKAQAKRNFCVAYLILLVILLALACAVFLAFPKQLSDLAVQLRGIANEPRLPFT